MPQNRKVRLNMRIVSKNNNPLKMWGLQDLPVRITRAASKQTYYTIRLLMDRERRLDAFRAYAYFRWVDDRLDTNAITRAEKQEFIQRQQSLLAASYKNESPVVDCPEEQILVDLVSHDREKDSGLQIYLHNMMAVMAFDVERFGRRISQAELSHYTLMLARAVTEYMFYFIGHEDPPPPSPSRYLAVCGAHIVHMLRDLLGDIPLGYINIPVEVLESGEIGVEDLKSLEFRKWVYERTQLAHQYFEAGRQYISRVKSVRCRLAGFAYLARFEWMLKVIEVEGCCLRLEYPDRKSLSALSWILWRTFVSFARLPVMRYKPVDTLLFSGEKEKWPKGNL